MFYTGANYTFPSGDKLVHGQQGEVTGPGTGSHEGKGVVVRFPGNKVNINFYIVSLPGIKVNTVSLLLTSVRRLRAASAATPRLHPALTTPPTPRASPRQPLPRRPIPRCI